MPHNNYLTFSKKDLQRLSIIRKLIDGSIGQAEAAEMLYLTTRQIRRIVKRVMIYGDAGIIHQARGKTSNRQYPQKIKDRVIELYREKYEGIGPASAVEKLSKEDRICINRETLRKWLVESGDWKADGEKVTDTAIVDIDMSSLPKDTALTKTDFVRGENNSDSHTIHKESENQRKKTIKKTSKRKYIPPADHPWRRLMHPQYAVKYKRES